ncbi:adult enhancer factor 1-like [Brienomyrus brachyistius]|uniref:adult enhancer factor 1-like n=1 Tax=Brienomyrus brachyistius TaxID=42636 RepID=UPI0020B1FB43|nr:adult enhancer factor 1-like [Brienomyrus brachyistius]
MQAAMPNCAAFQAQLSSIMEALTKAAVAEICELVDDGYAVLHLEISRSQEENEALKRKLEMMELRMARRCGTKSGELGSAVHSRLNGMLPCSEPRAARKKSVLQGKEKTYNKQWTVDEGEPAAKIKPAEKDDGRAEPIVIKEENLYESLEDSDQERRKRSRERAEEPCSDGESGCCIDTQTKLAEDAEKLPRQQRTRSGTCEDIGLDSVVKSEPDDEAGAHHPGGLECDFGTLRQRGSQPQAFFAQAASETEAEEPACSYSVKAASSDVQMAGSEEQPASTAGKSPCSLLSPKRSEVVMKDANMTVPMADRAEGHSTWSKESMLACVYPQHVQYDDFGEAQELQSDILTSMCLPLVSARKNAVNSESDMGNLTTSAGGKSPRKAGTREKRFICGYCGKCFTCPKYLQTHQRVHTGEKPYSCLQCGKRFAQSGYLKKHQNVHTGAKPFGCKQCGKRFADSSNLIRHRSVHTGEKPFICTYCGERFAGKHNLKIHQQRNHPALWSVR